MSYCVNHKPLKDEYLRIFFISLICLLKFNLILCQDGLNNITEICIKNCHEENQTILESINNECGKDCYIKQCTLGCSLWEEALSSSCQTVCNKTDNEPMEIYCTICCNEALNYYFKWIRNEIGILPPPLLKSDTLSTTSLTLEWKIPKKLAILSYQKSYLPKSYLVQWRYEDINDDWKFYRNQSINYNSTVYIDNLIPYKSYRFRIVLPLSLSNLNEMLVSEESLIITTLASGIPLSEPQIVRAVAVDHTRIFVSWEPGPFINGPIISYSLELKILSSESLSAFKDIPATENTNFYIFEKLLPSKNYSIEVSMHNNDGDGPHAKIFVETPSSPIINNNEPELRLILGSEYSIVSQGSDFLFDPPKEFYKSVDRIMGVAIHISKSLVFVSDEAGYIYKAPLEQDEKITNKRKEAILSPKSDINFLPTLLSLDWLNDHLYILGEINQPNSQKLYQITRCNLNGQNLIVAITGLYKKPNHIQVDPLNGYLYWSISGNNQNDGLFRLDLSYIINDIKPELRPLLQLINGGNLGAFIIDYLKYQILIPAQLNNTIYSFSLDGKIKENIRNNTQSPKLNLVKSITIVNGIFYWTNGNDIFTEDYHAEQNTYYHNQYPGKLNTIFISIALPSIQPLPIPLNPPRNLQVLLSSRKAKIIWNKPDLLNNQGKGSWQEWYYELKIIDDSNINNVIRDIKGTYFTIDRLKPNTNYTFIVLAYTINGRSPYSKEFQSKTLKTNHDRYIIWSSDDGLLQSDIIGEHIHTLISKNKLENYDITDITWFEDMLFFVSNSSLKYYNRTSNILAQFNDIESVESIDIDWIGKKIYWSIPSQQYITRTNFNGLDKEYLPILGVVKEFKIDSLNGYIYYSTGTAIEACRLNGKHRISYINFQPYTSQIMGLTFDIDHEKIYWIVRNYNGSYLYSAPIARHWRTDMIPIVILLPSQTISQSLTLNRLTHFSDRLMWLQDDHTVIVSDNIGKNLARIQSDKLNGLRSISVIDPTHHIFPTDITTSDINVIPESINNDTIKFNGTWRSFNISWEPVRTVTYGEIFYEIRIRHIDSDLLKDETSISNFLYTNHTLSPYTLLDVSIRPLTYWGSAKTSIAHLYTPVAPPSEPTKPNVFILHHNDPFRRGINISAIFRWNQPEKLNGPKIRYKIYCWYKDNERDKFIFNDFNNNDNNEIIISNLLSNKTYYFQNQGYSISNEGGPKTNYISVNTSHENPIPKLLLIKQNQIIEFDMNLNKTKIILHTGNPIYHLVYIDNEKKLFWINENNELICYTINENGGNKRKIAIINGNIITLTIDWIQRIIYWVQYDQQYDENINNSIIYRLDLNRYDGKTMIGEKFISSTQYIKDLIISPLNQKLYWLQYADRNTKYGNLIQYSINLNMELELPNNNNCLNDTYQRILFDTKTFNENNLILISRTEHIYSFGLESYKCELMKMHYNNNTKNIVKDSGHIYLLQNNTISMYNNKQILQYSMNITNIINILAYYHQNYPHKLCLLPRKNISNINYIPELIKKTENSIYIQLPQIETYSNCTLKLPGIKYIIEYSEQNNINDNFIKCPNKLCKTLISYDQITQITNLKSYTKYNLRIGVTNFYAQKFGIKILYGPILTYLTAPGPPSIPRNLTGETISPIEVIITWLKPEKLNSDKIWYEIHWQIEYSDIRVVNKQKRIILLPDENLIKNSLDKISISLKNLLPKHKYTIWIQAYSTNLTYSITPSIEIETFPEPENLEVIEKTANSLKLNWKKPKNIRKYIIEYSIINSDINYILIDSENDTRYDKIINDNYNENLIDNDIYIVNNLQPKTIYNFSIQLYYLNHNIPYIWPSDNRFLFETFGDHPNAPGKPKIYNLSGDVYKISWEPAIENGAAIEEYSLEALPFRISNRIKRSIENHNYDQINDNISNNQMDINIIKNDTAILIIQPDIINNNTRLLNQMQSIDEPDSFDENWLILYNGTENHCIKNDFTQIYLMRFRVRARNMYGWGPYSMESEPISEPYISPKRRDSLLLAIVVPVTVLVICFIFAACMIFVHQKRSTSKKHFHQTNSQIRDVELANLRELPCGGNFIHSANIIYSHGPLTDADIALLPQIRRNQIQTLCFLGSGAFGEVYEGIVRNDSNNSDIRVAIKTLRKGATEQEKGEFLQEAQLMSNFKHKHILQLIGICFDTDSLFIIMELMEGGDLLTYLRQSRPHMGVSLTLTLNDLISICVDVATGCRYLEEMHFVHRDLACRNCLVSSIDPEYRVVKIGDFGLARDIYKNDYYRKEGEGLLPVRWMSPESLVDGVFTSQSDIWAFGVLCWEIMTLGQQPYPARNNVEVLHYVRDGGRLSRPEDCPDGLYQLMLKCWSYHPEERPTFRYCLEILHLLQNNPNEEIHIEDNQSNKNTLAIGTLKLNNFDENSHRLLEPPIILTPTSSTTSTIRPKYIELLYDDNSGDEENQSLNIANCCDDYEIPIANIRNENSIECTSEIIPIDNFHGKSSVRNSLCSNNSITQIQNNLQNENKSSTVVEKSSKSFSASNLDTDNSKINNSFNLKINNNNNNIRHYNSSGNVNNNISTDIKLPQKTESLKPLNSQDNLSSKDLSSMNNDNLNSSKNNIENNQNQYETTDNIQTKM